MTDNLGPEIKIDGKRPDWLADDEQIGIAWLHGDSWDNLDTPADCVIGWESSVTAIRLCADHPYYLATSKGFTYWPGGDKAPDDWDGGAVLHCGGFETDALDWALAKEYCSIIGYRKRVEPVQSDDDYVRVKRMILDEYNGSVEWARRVGIIREETPLDQFERDHGGLDNNQRDIVEAFIEWQEKQK